MIIEFLNKMHSELLAEKLSLETEQNRIQIRLNENIRFIEKLKNEDDQNFDAFSPRKQNANLRSTINSLEQESSTISGELQDVKNRFMSLNCRLDELESVIKFAKNLRIVHTSNAGNSFGENDIFKLKILETQENERQRIARELHDSSIQSLTSIVHKTEFCSKLLDMDPIRCKLELASMSKVIREVIEEMRKMIYNLHPMSFDDIGFDVTLERELSKIEEKGIHASYFVEGNSYPLDSVISLTLLRIIIEACNNSVKHANPDIISVTMCYNPDFIKLIIKDNGKGFDVSEQKTDIRDDYSGFGLSTMKERVCLLSGTMDIISKIGEGTKIVIEVPTVSKEE